MSKKVFLFTKKDTSKASLYDFLKSHLKEKLVHIPDGYLRKYIEEGFAYVNDRSQTNTEFFVQKDAAVSIVLKLRELKKFTKPPSISFDLKASDILFEDDDIIMVNKPFNLPTHSTLNPDRDHLVASIKRFLKARDQKPVYLGIHQRLDKDTSGVILFTKNPDINKPAGKLFEERRIEKTYLVLTMAKNHIPEKFKIENKLTRSRKDKRKMISAKEGDTAITHFKVLRKVNKYFVIEAQPETGRTHQIRVHLSEKGLPVLGDPIYGPQNLEKTFPRLFLHALKLEFAHPRTQKKMKVQAPVPEEYFDVVGKFSV